MPFEPTLRASAATLLIYLTASPGGRFSNRRRNQAMIIDIHGHVSAPTELWAYKANLLSARGAHGRGGVNVSDDEIRAAANRKENWAKGHLDYLRDHGTDVQLISPRPFQLMQSEKPARLVHWFTEECNNIIHRQMKLFPGQWIGVC